MKTILSFAIIILTGFSVRADKLDAWNEASPDKTLFAAERRIPDADMIHRLDLDGFRLVISKLDHEGVIGDVVARHDFERLLVSSISWSPDSRFLIFTTTSSGGHSPWHFKAFVFCMNDRTFRYVEDVTGGSVIGPTIRFEPPDIAILSVRDVSKPDLGNSSEMPSRQVKIPLHKLSQKMKCL
jgi:hypothetical protein